MSDRVYTVSGWEFTLPHTFSEVNGQRVLLWRSARKLSRYQIAMSVYTQLPGVHR